MIDLLRFVGLVNVAVWFGSAVYQALGVGPAANSLAMRELLGSINAGYFSGVISQLLQSKMFYLHLVCGAIALLHAFGEWLYLGKNHPRWWVGLLAGLVALNLLNGVLLHPHLKRLHAARYALNFPAERRQSAARSFAFWQSASGMVDIAVVLGLGICLWRTANSTPMARFVSAVKFRS